MKSSTFSLHSECREVCTESERLSYCNLFLCRCLGRKGCKTYNFNLIKLKLYFYFSIHSTDLILLQIYKFDISGRIRWNAVFGTLKWKQY